MPCGTNHALHPATRPKRGLRALRAEKAGAELFRIDGVVLATPTRSSIQIGRAMHVDPLTGAWHLIEHSCSPNLLIDFDRWVWRAARDIAAGERLSVNYLTTEAEMVVPFDCRCADSGCFGRIAGFAHLDAKAQWRLRGHVAPHLRRVADNSSGGCIFGGRSASCSRSTPMI